MKGYWRYLLKFAIKLFVIALIYMLLSQIGGLDTNPLRILARRQILEYLCINKSGQKVKVSNSLVE